ncbi:hypothetical protein G6O67_008506 [Ophiocordyceps sinensis]|uniref:Uncharacterized protein n=2 Tax=Ophiocordyceps sinensis TaxID=72228 RepID=A0A8H4LSI0_9HYPO|nr:hypothetical protein OCS_02737 [Ophiocordyceps sinensis CO18]KAF4504346.1 hypothetical protein G6O67_008506 [Ophiocordyceps sinensis]
MKASHLLSIALPLATALAPPGDGTYIEPQPDTSPEDLSLIKLAVADGEELLKNVGPGEEQKPQSLETRSDVGHMVDLAV